MEPSPNTPGRIAFAQFEADLRSGELRKHGRKIRLQPQPFQLLALLLEHPREVVSREEVCQKLWPDGTQVDFDHGLGTALNKLREALNDSAENPRFIETLPRRGFRFIGTLLPSITETAPLQNTPPVAEKTKNAQFSWKTAAALLGLVSLVLTLAYVWRQRTNAAALAMKPVVFTAYEGQEVAPSFSPDGSRIAFGWTPGKGALPIAFDLYVKTIGDENPVRLTNTPSWWIASAWSPDGRTIALHRAAKEGTAGIYLIPAQGGPEQKLRSTHLNHSMNAAISWSPDGHALAFTDAPAPDGKRKIQILSLATLQTTEIPHDERCVEERDPAFSRDGTRLAYICSLKWDQYALAVQELSQAKPKILKAFFGWAPGLAWRADDRSLIFGHDQVGQEDDGLHELALSDLSVRPVPYGQQGAWPAIAARGARLAFSTETPDRSSIWRLDLTNLKAPPVQLISSTRLDSTPQYSPDGTHIAFSSSRSGHGEIWISDAAGKELLQVTKMDQASGSPKWSPDGRKLVFDSRENGHAFIYIVDVEERTPRKVALNVQEPSVPSWSRDGKWIYFIAGAGSNGGRIYRALAEGGDATPLSTSSGYGPVESWNRQSVVFASPVGTHARLQTVSLNPTGTEAFVKGMPDVSYASIWTVTSTGVFFCPATSVDMLTYFDFATQKVQPIYQVGYGAFYGVSVSPDGHYALYSKTEPGGSEIMLVNNFR